MATMNLLILIFIICVYLSIGGGIYKASCLIIKYPEDELMLTVSMVIWPLMLIIIIPLILIIAAKKILIFFLSFYIQEVEL